MTYLLVLLVATFHLWALVPATLIACCALGEERPGRFFMMMCGAVSLMAVGASV